MKKKTKPQTSPKNDRVHNPLGINDRINIATAILTFMSVLAMFLTIYEMKVERDMTYRPILAINPVEVSFSWDENGIEDCFKITTTSEETSEISADESSQGSLNFNYQLLNVGDGFFSNFDVTNIGVGTAKDIVLNWRDTNTDYLIDHLLSLDNTKKDFCVANESVVFSYEDNHIFMVSEEHPTVMMYLLPGVDEKFTLPFPTQYSVLIHEIIKTGKYNNDQYLLLFAEYNDIHGKEYYTPFLIQIIKVFYNQNADGSGSATYQLVPALQD